MTLPPLTAMEDGTCAQSELDQWLAREAPPHTPEDEVDGIMAGDPDAEITGIAVTWLPNIDVLERAASGVD